jgi:hypothetical protein
MNYPYYYVKLGSLWRISTPNFFAVLSMPYKILLWGSFRPLVNTFFSFVYLLNHVSSHLYLYANTLNLSGDAIVFIKVVGLKGTDRLLTHGSVAERTESFGFYILRSTGPTVLYRPDKDLVFCN